MNSRPSPTSWATCTHTSWPLPFDLLAIAVALNLFLGGWKGETNLRFYRLSIDRTACSLEVSSWAVWLS